MTYLSFSDDNIPLNIQLRYLMFNTLLHKISHWLHFDPNCRLTFESHMQYKNWFGENIEQQGEAEFFIESEVWGGIIKYIFPHVSVEGVVKGLYQMLDNNILHQFKNIGLIVRHLRSTKDMKREQICELSSFVCSQIC